MCSCLLHYWGPDLAHNPGMCPDWESNWRAFGSRARAQSTEPHQPEQNVFLFFKLNYLYNTSFLCPQILPTLRLFLRKYHNHSPIYQAKTLLSSTMLDSLMLQISQ